MMKKTIVTLVSLAILTFGNIPETNAYTIVNGTFVDPAGMTYGTLLGGSDSGGYTPNPTTFGYTMSSDWTGYGDARDWYWVQDIGCCPNDPTTGLIYDLGGQANQLVVFPIIDHGPLPGEAYEYNVYLSNDQVSWVEAELVTLYDQGWSPDPNIADGWTTVWQLAGGATARYASITWCNPGNPDPSFEYCDGDNEIDAVAGLTESGEGLNGVPEPSTLLLLATGLIGLAFFRRKEEI